MSLKEYIDSFTGEQVNIGKKIKCLLGETRKGNAVGKPFNVRVAWPVTESSRRRANHPFNGW